MSTRIEAEHVEAVLLADGWHNVVPGTFRIGPSEIVLRNPGDPTDVFETWSGWPNGFSFQELSQEGARRTVAGPITALLAVATF